MPRPEASSRRGSAADGRRCAPRAPAATASIRSTPAASASHSFGGEIPPHRERRRRGRTQCPPSPRGTRARRQRVGAEEHPADHHDQQRVDMPWTADGRRGRETDSLLGVLRAPCCGTGHALDDQERAVQQAPDHEVPARAVPQAAEEEHRDQVAVHPRRRHAVAAERDVEVVAEPGRQRDVPAPPELLHRVGDVRLAEVLREAEAEHPAEPDRHVRVAGEVEVDLQRVADDPEPGVAGR